MGKHSAFIGLLAASSEGHTAAVELLLNCGAEVNPEPRRHIHRVSAYYIYSSPLVMASYNGHTETAKLLLIRGANSLDEALCAATKEGHLEIAELLLQYGASPNCFLKASFFPEYHSHLLIYKTPVLMIAVSKGHLGLSSLLLECGANVNNPIPDPRNKKKKHFESIYRHMGTIYPQSTPRVVGRLDMIKLLLLHDADIRKTELNFTDTDITPFNIAFTDILNAMEIWRT